MTKKELISKYNFTEKDGKYYYEGDLNLPNFNGTLPESLTVGGYLHLPNFNGTLPESLTVGGNLNLNSFTGTLPESLTVGGNLYLPNFNGTLPESLTVGGNLNLPSFTGTLPDTLTVGGNLNLDDFTGTLPESLTVGGYLNLPSFTGEKKHKNLPENYVFQWENGNKKYIKIDGIFSELIDKKGKVYITKRIGKEDTEYIVTDGINYSHGKTIKEAKESLIYKISDRDTSKYKDWKLEDVKTKAELIQCYRAISGSCEAGTRYFCEQNKIPNKCTISEMIKITENQYKNEVVKEFFNSKL
jgi:hypothetical protein